MSNEETSVEETRRFARSVIAGSDCDPSRAIASVKALKRVREFGLARKMLAALWRRPAFQTALVQRPELRLTVVQLRALTTYKDPDLSTSAKLDDALAILRSDADLHRTLEQETLGLAGAICKRMWEHAGRTRQLELSASYYLRGFERGETDGKRGLRGDKGYTAINAAFVLDQIADVELPQPESELPISAGVLERREQARRIRRQIADELPNIAREPGNEGLLSDWWVLVTIGEAFFGLGEYDAAREWLLRAKPLRAEEHWEFESTARQLAALHNMKRRARAESAEQLARARDVLLAFLGEARAALDSAVRGKVGLALSGGGFRASLFHLGVLAKLAELDLLRHVEYLSCVSGGSIVGAHYYLALRKLLEDGPKDGRPEITRDDYIELVAHVCDTFVAGVQRNIRTRIAAEWTTNVKMIFLPNYSRTVRAGELYESEIYAHAGDGSRERVLKDLFIRPKDAAEDFRPKDHNWRRVDKVPILVLNATSLNTGHNWQFTASWMGEPPAGIAAHVDANSRLRRLYHKDAPPAHRSLRLGHAVAASAGVPGLFEPLSLAGLYEQLPGAKAPTIVRLVDGGVHDNQGVAALLEQDCSVILVSDASGQMDDESAPSTGLLGVPLRSNAVLQSRVRVGQYEDLASRHRGGLLKGLMFVHLKRDLGTRPVDWIDCDDRSPAVDPTPTTPYGVDREVQRRLAGMRTDLDSFTLSEAYALMTSGYLMTEHDLVTTQDPRNPILGFPVAGAAHPWKFLTVRSAVDGSDVAAKAALLEQLSVSGQLAFKVWRLHRGLQALAIVVGLGLLSALVYWIGETWTQQLLHWTPTVGQLVLGVATFAIGLTGAGWILKVLHYRKTLQQIAFGVGMATCGFLAARLHLHVFDRMFLRQGRVRPPRAPAGNGPPSASRPTDAARPPSRREPAGVA